MNHRELMQSARRMTRSSFLTLPEELQDRVIDGLDRGDLTMVGAADLIRQAGCSLSHEGVSNYYQAVRRERRLHDGNLEMARLVSEFAQAPTEDALKAVLNVALGMTALGLADGTVGVRNLDLARLLTASAGLAKPATSASGGSAEDTKSRAETPAVGGLSDDQADLIKRKILGIDR